MTTPFFRSCFHPKRLTNGICAADLVRSWARHHPPDDVQRAVDQIGGLLSSGFSDDRLRVLVLGSAGCGFDPGLHGLTMYQWLGMVRDVLMGRTDFGLPAAAFEPMAPWPGQEPGAFDALRSLLDCFHRDWRADSPTFEGVVQRFVEEEGPRLTAELVDDIDRMLDLGLDEERLRIIVLGRWRSSYDPRPDLPGGQTMAQWLRSVRGVAVSASITLETA
ncbi:MAG TPA: contact-dependent growth inhibition system immunity protein [Acidimicrobiales bacterium]|nr:contact-dependent growth inhibition system immunity protein [Acidimicrobiales bacterium]